MLSKFNRSIRSLNKAEREKWPAFVIKIQDHQKGRPIEDYLRQDSRSNAKDAFLSINGLKSKIDLEKRSVVKTLIEIK